MDDICMKYSENVIKYLVMVRDNFRRMWQKYRNADRLFLVHLSRRLLKLHYCDHALSVVRPSSLTFHIFDFSSETVERNSTKVDRKKDLDEVCIIQSDRKNKMATQPLIGWDISDFSSGTAEWNSTNLHRKQDLNVLYQICIFRPNKKKQDDRLSLWVAETFSTSPLQLQNGIQRNLTYLNVLYQVCVFSIRSENQDGRHSLWLA